MRFFTKCWPLASNILLFNAVFLPIHALQELLKHQKIRRLLEVPDRYDNTPLHVAARNGYLTTVKVSGCF